MFIRKEKMEEIFVSSDFDKALNSATGASGSSSPSPSEFALIAEQTFTQEGLLKVFEVIKQRLDSGQQEHWLKAQKTLRLVEYLMLNGSQAFVQVFSDCYKDKVAKWTDCKVPDPDQEEKIHASAKRIIDFCSNSAELEKLRAENDEIRNKKVSKLARPPDEVEVLIQSVLTKVKGIVKPDKPQGDSSDKNKLEYVAVREDTKPGSAIGIQRSFEAPSGSALPMAQNETKEPENSQKFELTNFVKPTSEKAKITDFEEKNTGIKLVYKTEDDIEEEQSTQSQIKPESPVVEKKEEVEISSTPSNTQPEVSADNDAKPAESTDSSKKAEFEAPVSPQKEAEKDEDFKVVQGEGVEDQI